MAYHFETVLEQLGKGPTLIEVVKLGISAEKNTSNKNGTSVASNFDLFLSRIYLQQWLNSDCLQKSVINLHEISILYFKMIHLIYSNISLNSIT